MIRKLLLVAALLAPCLAYGGDPSSNLSVEVVPPGVKPQMPAGAAAAGFTTLALDSDFTKQMPAGWLGGCPTPGNGQWPLTPQFFDDGKPHIWWQNIWWSAQYQGCSTGPVTDPVFGGTVLDMPWTVDNVYNAVGTTIQTASWDYNQNGGWPTNAQGQSHDYPNNAYYEVTLRQTPIAAGVYSVLNTWGPLGISPDKHPNGWAQTIEWDMEEVETGALWKSDAAVHNQGNGNQATLIWCGMTGCSGVPGGLPGNFDPNQYHTYGMRVTSDGNDMVGCAYVDDKFVNCAHVPNGLNDFQKANGRNFLVLQNACDWWNQPNGQCTQGQEQHLYVKSVRVWSCADWQTAQCNRSVLTGAP
jgi:hypothetical protein